MERELTIQVGIASVPATGAVLVTAFRADAFKFGPEVVRYQALECGPW